MPPDLQPSPAPATDPVFPSPRSKLLTARRPRWRRRLAWLTVSCCLLLALYAFRAPLLVGLAKAWIVDDPLEHADIIVVLGGGPSTRPFEAARLYHQDLTPKIMIMKSVPDQAVQLGIVSSEAEILKKVLLKQGVPEADIAMADEEVSSTYAESIVVRNWAETNHVHSMIIATDVFHTRRVQWLFRKQFKGSGVQVMVRAVPVREYSTNDWWGREQGLIAFQNEVLKYAYYRLRY